MLLIIHLRSVGRTFRSLAESEPKPLTENFAIKEAITTGEMVSKESLDKLLHSNILELLNKKGIIIDGYPRDMSQIKEFQEKVSVWIIDDSRATIIFLRFYSTIKFRPSFSLTVPSYNLAVVVWMTQCRRLEDGWNYSGSSHYQCLNLWTQMVV